MAQFLKKLLGERQIIRSIDHRLIAGPVELGGQGRQLPTSPRFWQKYNRNHLLQTPKGLDYYLAPSDFQTFLWSCKGEVDGVVMILCITI